MAAKIKGVTLESEVITYVEEQAKMENRNFSNMINTICKRYKLITEQLDEGGRKIDLVFRIPSFL